MIEITVPYPPKELNPNTKLHWAAKMGHIKMYRGTCKAIACESSHDVPMGDLVLDLEFFPPDNRRRDDDNMIASFKAGRDGIAEALEIDDVKFQLRVRTRDKFPGGKVVVKIYEDTE
jgi:crossover junction endodeoxyribonuclease RusA